MKDDTITPEEMREAMARLGKAGISFAEACVALTKAARDATAQAETLAIEYRRRQRLSVVRPKLLWIRGGS